MIVGIDLGTTNSLAAVWRDGEPRLVPNALGEFLTPSIVNLIMVRLIGISRGVQVSPRVRVTSQLTSLSTIFIMPLMSIVPALLYLKMRQLGGETLGAVMDQINEVEGVHSHWQQRMRTRLTVTPQTRTPTF